MGGVAVGSGPVSRSVVASGSVDASGPVDEGGGTGTGPPSVSSCTAPSFPLPPDGSNVSIPAGQRGASHGGPLAGSQGCGGGGAMTVVRSSTGCGKVLLLFCTMQEPVRPTASDESRLSWRGVSRGTEGRSLTLAPSPHARPILLIADSSMPGTPVARAQAGRLGVFHVKRGRSPTRAAPRASTPITLDHLAALAFRSSPTTPARNAPPRPHPSKTGRSGVFHVKHARQARAPPISVDQGPNSGRLVGTPTRRG